MKTRECDVVVSTAALAVLWAGVPSMPACRLVWQAAQLLAEDSFVLVHWRQCCNDNRIKLYSAERL